MMRAIPTEMPRSFMFAPHLMRGEVESDFFERGRNAISQSAHRTVVNQTRATTYLNAGADGAGAEVEEALMQTETRDIFALTGDGAMSGRYAADEMEATPRHRGEEERRALQSGTLLRAVLCAATVRCLSDCIPVKL